MNQSKKEGKDQESIQLSTTPDPGCHMGKWHNTNSDNVSFLLINVKMPTIVGILTSVIRINTTSEWFQARKNHYFSAF